MTNTNNYEPKYIIDLNLTERAMRFAIKQHGTTLRKYDGLLYITHCLEVASIVRQFEYPETMIAAAWLHDTVEDTDCSTEDIYALFGADIARYVDDLTDISKPSDGNRAVRKAIDLEHSKNSCPEAQTIKLADIISNSVSICKYDLGFARTYIPEMRKLLDVLRRCDFKMWRIANDIVMDCEFFLRENKK